MKSNFQGNCDSDSDSDMIVMEVSITTGKQAHPWSHHQSHILSHIVAASFIIDYLRNIGCLASSRQIPPVLDHKQPGNLRTRPIHLPYLVHTRWSGRRKATFFFAL